MDTRVAHTFALTVNLDFQSQARYNHDTIGDHEKMMVIGQLVQIIFWKETDRQTDTTDHFAVGNAAEATERDVITSLLLRSCMHY